MCSRLMGLAAVALALLGCTLAHEPIDAGVAHEPIDARVAHEPVDAGVAQDAIDASPETRACTAPIAEWPRVETSYPGTWSRLLGTRDRGQAVVLVVGGDGVHLLRFEREGPIPVVASDVVLEGVGPEPFALAVGEGRVVTASDRMLGIFDMTGRSLARGTTRAVEPSYATMIVRGGRAAITSSGGRYGGWVELHDLSDGTLIVETMIDPYPQWVALGSTADALSVAVTWEPLPTELYRLDDTGLSSRSLLEVCLAGASSDGLLWTGWAQESPTVGDVVVRHPDGSIDRRGRAGGSAIGVGTLADGAYGAIVVLNADAAIMLSTPAGDWIELGRSLSGWRAVPEQGNARRRVLPGRRRHAPLVRSLLRVAARREA